MVEFRINTSILSCECKVKYIIDVENLIPLDLMCPGFGVIYIAIVIYMDVVVYIVRVIYIGTGSQLYAFVA